MYFSDDQLKQLGESYSGVHSKLACLTEKFVTLNLKRPPAE